LIGNFPVELFNYDAESNPVVEMLQQMVVRHNNNENSQTLYDATCEQQWIQNFLFLV